MSMLMYPKKIVVLLPKYIGDSIMATPALQLIEHAYPDAAISVVCRQANADIFMRSQFKVIVDPRCRNRTKGAFQLRQILQNEQFDIGFLFSNTFLDALCFKLGQVKQIAGYEKEARSFLLDHKLKIDRGRHYINRYAHLVNSFAGDSFRKLPPVRVPFFSRNSMVTRTNGEKLIGFYFGGTHKKNKHYPTDMAATIIKNISISPDNRAVIFGDCSEMKTSDALLSLLTPDCQCINLTGRTSITELVDTISSLDLLVTVDSSPMHIATAVGTKFIAIVGKTPQPFSAVKPKVTFGHYVESEGMYISDEDQMKDIYPERITDKIFEILYSARN